MVDQEYQEGGNSQEPQKQQIRLAFAILLIARELLRQSGFFNVELVIKYLLTMGKHWHIPDIRNEEDLEFENRIAEIVHELHDNKIIPDLKKKVDDHGQFIYHVDKNMVSKTYDAVTTASKVFFGIMKS